MKTLILSAILCVASQVANAADAGKLYTEHFPLDEIKLDDSPLRTAMVRNAELLLRYDENRLMTPFVRQAGLAATTDAASRYYGWLTKYPSFSNWGLSDWSLEGHVGGHYVSALALAIAAMANDTQLDALRGQLQERLNYCLQIMKDCQDAYAGNTEGLRGFIGGQPINLVWTGLYADDMTAFRKYGGWVPFYCQHKVLAGLRDAYVYTGSNVAKELFRGLSDWSVDVVGKLSDADMQAMLGWEHGGMNEALADAYYVFGDAKYLTAAKRFSHQSMIDGMQDCNEKFLNGKHANTQVPKYIGFERIWQLDNTAETYRVAAHNFWQDVTDNRTVCIGGNSVDEHFMAPRDAGRYISNLNGPESCNTNNMLKLSELLFDETHDARYADFYEAAMLNHVLSTQDPETGGYVYFTSLRPQSYRIYSKVNEGMWCCVGTGMENHSKYGHFAYTFNAEGKKPTLFVNLFTASELCNGKFALRQVTQFPYEPATKLIISKKGKFTLAIRKPSWTTGGYSVKVNGTVVYAASGAENQAAEKDGYVYVSRTWKKGDVVEVSLPMTLRTEPCPNLPEYVAFKYGPVLLAARTSDEGENLPNEYAGEGRMDHAPGNRATSLSVTSSPMLICSPDSVFNLIKLKDAGKLLFTITAPKDIEVNAPSSLWNRKHTLVLEPFANIHHARYCCYWYVQKAKDFASSDLGQSEARAALLNARTLDHVGTGEQQSEAGHVAVYSAGSTTGSFNGEFYRDARNDGFIQYTLVNTRHLTDSLAVMCRFTAADRGRVGYVSIDGVKLSDVKVNATSYKLDDKGFFDVEIDIPSELLVNADGSVKDTLVFRLTASSATLCPGIYSVRLVEAASER